MSKTSRTADRVVGFPTEPISSMTRGRKSNFRNHEPGGAKSPLIYIVDDEVMIGEVVTVVLRLDGWESRFFSDPEKALAALAEGEPKPALLLTDYLMNPINGMELIQRCKKEAPELKTILYSGNVGEEVLHFYPIKPDGFLSKPFLPKSLTEMVRKTISS